MLLDYNRSLPLSTHFRDELVRNVRGPEKQRARRVDGPRSGPEPASRQQSPATVGRRDSDT